MKPDVWMWLLVPNPCSRTGLRGEQAAPQPPSTAARCQSATGAPPTIINYAICSVILEFFFVILTWTAKCSEIYSTSPRLLLMTQYSVMGGCQQMQMWEIVTKEREL